VLNRNERHRMGSKGFLGPIGDDLPSLIPLILALVFFFGTFTFAFNVFNEKNADFQADLTVMNIARALKGTSLISSTDDFEKGCKSLNVTGLRFRAVITNIYSAREAYPYGDIDNPEPPPQNAYNIKEFITQTNPETGSPEDYPLICDNISGTEIAGQISDEESAENYFRRREQLVRIYPVAVQHNGVVYPMHLVVMAWRG